MDLTLDQDIMPRDWSEENSIIKVIGVGGGGCNAVNYMYKQKIKGCNFIVCNTDSQALFKSEVPTKIQMGAKGLGAGTDPVEGRNAALESQDEIAAKVLDNGTEMLFITAGMGGGTGTGASPVIAKMAKDRGILTVAVVTIPFKNEGNESQSKAVDGIHELEKNVDSLLIINNEKLYEFFGDTLAHEAFPMADEVLATAVRGIIEVITQPGYINVAELGHGPDGHGPRNGQQPPGGCRQGRLRVPAPERLRPQDREERPDQHHLRQQRARHQDEGTGDHRRKKGLIWDDDPEIGDKVRITAIVTGFDMGQLGHITDVNLGNIVIIDRDFQWETVYKGAEVPLPEMAPSIKVGFNTAEPTRRFHFTEDTKPCLCVEPGESISELEAIPAIRRAHEGKK